MRQGRKQEWSANQRWNKNARCQCLLSTVSSAIDQNDFFVTLFFFHISCPHIFSTGEKQNTARTGAAPRDRKHAAAGAGTPPADSARAGAVLPRDHKGGAGQADARHLQLDRKGVHPRDARGGQGGPPEAHPRPRRGVFCSRCLYLIHTCTVEPSAFMCFLR